MFKFFDKARSGPHAKLLKSFASISSDFPAHKSLLLYHHSGGSNRSFLQNKETKFCSEDSSSQLSRRLQLLFSAKTRKGSCFTHLGSEQHLQLDPPYQCRDKFSKVPVKGRASRPARVSTSKQGSPGELPSPQAWLIFSD